MTRQRQPDTTRKEILHAAFEEIYHKGFQAASVNAILRRTNLTKGAMYYHFPDKLSLGYAVVDELIRNFVVERWLKPLANCDDPVQCLEDVVQKLIEGIQNATSLGGCPLNNLCMEMSIIDEGFRQRMDSVYQLWCGEIAKVLSQGQASGKVAPEVNPQAAATFYVASLTGSLGLAKATQDKQTLILCAQGLLQYLKTLKVDTAELAKEN